ncbi:hypothetical protein FH966_05430 [Lentibacillus cibarius]|uniref:Uncharacterized protein n=1 Tax=Lentibacillus cibarius TaxID=2583219 RepID=A0A549YH39_9BACI|nr:hypothetical protein [Lentibacillus cibarius]TRM11205.1 hypothetical protein FH966_05430 [Lentibacillus cibarius]
MLFTEEAETEGLFPGYHVNLQITTDESPGAAAVSQGQLFGKNIWKMTPEGKLARQTVHTGISMDDLIEITSGASVGEWIATKDHGQFREDTGFITPLKMGDIEWKQLGKYDNVNWRRYIVTGLLAR